MAFGGHSSAYTTEQLSVFDDLLTALSRKHNVRELFQHLTAVSGQIIPHDEAQLVLRTEDGSRCLYARSRDGACEESAAETAGTVLDNIEPQVLDVGPDSERGLRSALKVPVKIEDGVVGALVLFSERPDGYSAGDLLHAQQLANCLGHGLAYQRLTEQARDAGSDRQRSAEIESCAELLRTISGVLDIRTVFPRISEIAKKMLPHDALAMVFVDQDRHFVRQAHAPDDFPDPPFVTHKTLCPENSSSPTSPPRHCRSLNPRTRSRP